MALPQNGIVSFRTNGEPIVIKGAVKYSLGGKSRESITGPTGHVGYKNVGNAAYIEIESLDSAETDILQLQALASQTGTLQLENGKVVSFSDMSVTNLIEVDAEDGAYTIRLEGPDAKEV